MLTMLQSKSNYNDVLIMILFYNEVFITLLNEYLAQLYWN